MTLSFKKSIFTLLGILLAFSCSPVDYIQVDLESEGLSQGFKVSNRGENSSTPDKEFKLRSKLDIVFVLDTQEVMSEFYEEHLIGEDFLFKINKYDWRMAYTNTAVSPRIIEFQKDLPQMSLDDSKACGVVGWLFNAGITALGIGFLFGGEESLITKIPLFQGTLEYFKETARCTKEAVKEVLEDPKFYGNGQLQAFEMGGKRQDHLWISRSVEGYEKMYQDSFKWSSQDVEFDAPVKSDDKPYPYRSMLLSLDHGAQGSGDLISPSGEIIKQKFFREDSLVVYVVVTLGDSDEGKTATPLKRTVTSYFKQEDRFVFIPVVFYPLGSKGGHDACRRGYPLENSPYLINVAKGMDKTWPPIELCLPGARSEIYERSVGDQIYKRIEDKLFDEKKVLKGQAT